MTKSALITGASEGLGRCFAQQLAQKGYAITAVARNEERLKELVEQLPTDGNREHSYLAADLATDSGQQRCLNAIELNKYDLLVNNAGFSFFGHFSELSVEGEEAVMKVNMGCMLKLTHAFLQTAQKGDAIINLSSLTYRLPTPVQASYVASKCWVAAFSEALWYQCSKDGVYVQGLCPGIAKTEFIDRATNNEMNYKWLIDLIAVSPDSVVRTSLNALEKKRGPIIVPGFANKLIAVFMNLLPRKVSVYMMGKIGDLA